MSASEPETAIFTTDSSELVKKKIWKAFTGGKGTIAEQKSSEPTQTCARFSNTSSIYLRRMTRNLRKETDAARLVRSCAVTARKNC